MRNTSKTVGITLALFISLGVISGCQNKGPASTDNTGSQTNTTGQTSIKTSVEVQNSLASYHEDDASFSDSASVADESGLKTKALLGPLEGTGPIATAVATKNKVTAAAKAKIVKENAVKAKAKLQASGAVTVNADGTLTVDPAKLKAAIKNAVDASKTKLKARVEKLKDKLALKKDVAKATIQKLKRKNNVARTSDAATETNADGSVTKTLSIHFENPTLKLTRDIIISKTFDKDGKLISIDYSLEAKANNYSRTATRTVTVNADGSRNISTQSTTTWPNGKTREINEERIVNADGSATGSGTITTTVNGQTKTINFTSGVTAGATADAGTELTTIATDPATNLSVTIDESADGSASVAVTESGAETETDIDIEATAATEGSVTTPTPEETGTPAPSATPAESASPAATATPAV
jgi:hypothetical protein